MHGTSEHGTATTGGRTERRAPHLTTAAYEDSGLFKTGLVEIAADLSPVVTRNSRADYVVKGLIDGRHEVRIVFAGRRKSEARSFLRMLANMGVRPGSRWPAQLYGAWRRVIREDQHGFAAREYEFLVASWAIPTPHGTRRQFGLPPAIRVNRAI